MLEDEDLQKIFAEEEPIPEEAPTKDKDLTWDEEPPEMPESFPEVVKLTPETDTIKNLFAETPTAAQTVDLQAVEAKIDLRAAESEVNAMREKLLEASQVSMNQPKLYLQEQEFEGAADSDELIDAMTKGMNSQARANIKGRFSTLEELMGKGENLPGVAEAWIPTDLLFKFGEWQVKEEARLSLMRLGIIIITNNKDSQFIIKGFTDSIPFRQKDTAVDGPRNNQELSQLRANAVRDYLVASLHLHDYDIRSVGYGARNPLVIVAPSGNIQQDILREGPNRRVEIEIRSGSENLP